MKVKDVCKWLKKIEVKESVIDLFESSSVDGKMLMSLTDEDLERMGVKNFMLRRKILKRRDENVGRNPPVYETTWRYTIARCVIFIVIFFALHTTMNKYVLEPYFKKSRARGSSNKISTKNLDTMSFHPEF